MSNPLFAEAVYFAVGMYMGLSLLLHMNLFHPRHARTKVVLITDTDCPLGRQVALEYSKMNAKLFLVGADQSALSNLTFSCLKSGADDVKTLSGDVTSSEFRRQIAASIGQSYGRLHYAILLPDGPIDWSSWNDTTHLKTTVDTYLVASADLLMATMPLLRRNRGYVGVVTTLTGTISVPHSAAASATRAALHGYLASLRQELKRDGDFVSVTSVTLGYVRGVDGGWGGWLSRWGTVSLEDAAIAAVAFIGGRKKEVTYPFAAQCHSVIRNWFPSLYENLQMPDFMQIIPRFPFINMQMY